jgi:Ion channel
MPLVVFSCLVLLLLTTVIHYEILRLLTVRLPTFAMPTRAKLILVILGTFFAHVVEIILYAVAIYVLVHYLGAGTLGNSTQTSWNQCLYFSAETYSSLGYGDVVPGRALRMFAGMEVLNGLLLIGWSASYTYISMEHFWQDED